MIKIDYPLGYAQGDRDTHISVLNARLSVLVAQEAEKNAIKMEKATKRIEFLTWFIAVLTCVMLFTYFIEFPKFSPFSTTANNSNTFKIESRE